MVPDKQLSSWCVNRRSESKCARSKGSNFHADKGNGRCPNASNCPRFKATSKTESAVSRDYYPPLRSGALRARSIDVVCLWTRSIAISGVRSLDTSSMTCRRWQNFRFQLSVPPPCSMASRLMARISRRLIHRPNVKPLLSQLVMTQPLAGTTARADAFSAAARGSPMRCCKQHRKPSAARSAGCRGENKRRGHLPRPRPIRGAECLGLRVQSH
jgi:hypothetical protein